MLEKLDIHMQKNNRILFSLKKEGIPDICDNMMYLENIILSEMSQTQKEKYCIILPTRRI